MKRVSLLLAVVMSVAALFAVAAGAASAETAGVLCKQAPASHECVNPSKYSAGTEFTANLVSGTYLRMVTSEGSTVNQCTASSLKLRYDGGSSLEYVSASFTGCTHEMKDKSAGQLSIKWKEATDNGLFSGSGQLFETELPFVGRGVYGLSGGGVELIGGSSPKLNFNKANLVGVSGSTGSGLKLVGEFNLSPTPIYVEKQATPGVLCGISTCASRYPAGTEFTATQASGISTVITGPFGETYTSCAKSTIKLKYDGGSELKYAGSTWTECSRPTSDASAGALFVKFREGSTEPFAGEGSLLEMTLPLYGTGTFGLTGEGIELVQGSTPQLVFNKAKVVGISQPNQATMTGRYNLSPTPLYLGKG